MQHMELDTQVHDMLGDVVIDTPEALATAQYAVLCLAVDVADMTSGHLMQVNTETRISTVRQNYVARRTTRTPIPVDDIGEEYDETAFPLYRIWLSIPNPPIRELHRDELRLSDPEIDELMRYGVHSVLNIAVMQDDHLWGYVEMWETRFRRCFDLATLDDVERILRHMPTRLQ